MSEFGPAPQKPDSRIFASYPMPAKIDLLQERPRRESLIEKQLEHKIGQQVTVPKIEITEQRTVIESQWTSSNQGPVEESYRHQVNSTNYATNNNNNEVQQIKSSPIGGQQSQMVQQQNFSITQNPSSSFQTTTTNQARNILNDCIKNNAANLAAELAEKEAKLMAEINALHQRPYSPFQTPSKIDLTNEQRKQQQQYENAPPPRPASRIYANATSADFLDKEAKLLQEIEEIEKKPFNPQTMVVEREQWYEYPEGRPYERHLTDSKRRVRDFCSLPSHMYQGQDRHIHEENLLVNSHGQSPIPSSIHTTIIRSSRREVDNKSPLPFAFDNFTTKGVRGNIASVGAIEPDRPRPPIYPIIKRSPSPKVARG